jgi:hypothetical protein
VATADFWTSALPVIGTIGGGLLVSITSALTTGRRDRNDRLGKYCLERRTSIIGLLHAVSSWVIAASSAEAALSKAEEMRIIPGESDQIREYLSIEAKLDKAIIEASIIVRNFWVNRLIDDVRSAISRCAERQGWARGIAHVPAVARVAMADSIADCVSLRVEVVNVTKRLEEMSGKYFRPRRSLFTASTEGAEYLGSSLARWKIERRRRNSKDGNQVARMEAPWPSTEPGAPTPSN